MRSITAIPFKGVIPRDRGPVPELRWIEIDLLRVDDAYQRPISAQGEANVRAIVAHFDWRKFAPVVVCPVEGGVYAIVDGQHRTTAALICGIGAVPCLVIQADRRMQAEAFSAINGRVTKVTAVSLYTARLASGDPLALRIKAIGDAADVRILTFNPHWKSLKPRETAALAAIERVMLAYDDATASRALAAVAASADTTPGLIGAFAIQAFANVLADHREWRDDAGLMDAVTTFCLEEMVEKARGEAARRRMGSMPLLEALLITHLEAAFAPKQRLCA